MICDLCPRRCGALRTEERGLGRCRMPELPVLARAALHRWEEPPISGTRGSGTIFFSGCSLGCVFCQNEEISHRDFGKAVTLERLARICGELVDQGAHNLNFVNPTHYAHVVGRLLEEHPVHTGDTLTLTGQLRSFNNRSGQGPRLVISVFVRELTPGGAAPFNQIQLSGVLCKAPSLRRTPLGREICDLILAVNRRYGRADYLPCIAWGAIAQQAARLPVGSRLTVEGRVQSRGYTKTVDGVGQERTAYEVSIMRPAEPEEFLL